jgi:hypothetical protein
LAGTGEVGCRTGQFRRASIGVVAQPPGAPANVLLLSGGER